jgi:hypothetical protein
MKAGFFNNPPPKKKAQPTPATQKVTEVEDMTHLKAQSKQEKLKIEEVQQTMNYDALQKSKDQWLTPDLLQTLMSKPHLMQVFQDPQFSTVLQEMQQNP